MIAIKKLSYSILLDRFLSAVVHVMIPIAAQVTQIVPKNAAMLLRSATKLRAQKIGFLQAIRSMYKMFCIIAESK